MLFLEPLTALGLMTMLSFRQTGGQVRLSYLYALVTWGLTIAVSTEILSFLRAFTQQNLVILWICICGLCVFGMIYFTVNVPKIRRPCIDLDDYFIFFILAIIFSVILVVTYLNELIEWDSLTYHLSRVAHWRQNRNIGHYPTNLTHQLFMPPWSEYAILHFWTLSPFEERSALLVAVFALLGALAGVTIITEELGGDRTASRFSAMAVLGIPSVMAQSSNTMTDLPCGFFLVAFVALSLLYLKSEKKLLLVMSAISIALAMLTKGTTFIFGALFAVFLASLIWKKYGFRSVFVWAFVAVAAITVINLPHWTRNYQTFGNPLNSPYHLYQFTIPNKTVPRTCANIFRNLANHFLLPWQAWNDGVGRVIQYILNLFSQDVDDQMAIWQATDSRLVSGLFIFPNANKIFNASYAPCFYPLFCILLGGLYFFWQFIKTGSNLRLFIYWITGFFSFVVFCGIVRWQPYHTRLLVPLFLLFTPALSVTLKTYLSKRTLSFVGFLFVMTSFPFLISIPFYNLSYWKDWINHPSSRRPRQPLYNLPAFLDVLPASKELVQNVRHSNCRILGLKIGHDPEPRLINNAQVINDAFEYHIWRILREHGVRAELYHVEVENPSSMYMSQSRRPEEICMILAIDQPGHWLPKGPYKDFEKVWKYKPEFEESQSKPWQQIQYALFQKIK